MDKNMNFSVLISIYNNEKPEYFQQAMQSIWNDQTLKPDEIVLVEDGPLNDELNAGVEKWQDKLKNVLKVIALPENVGLGVALKVGVEKCSHEITARMDADDIATPYRFEKQLAFLKKNPIFITVGHLSSGKHPLTVVRGFLAGEAGKHGFLVLLGEGPLKTECEKLSCGRSNVRIAGRVRNVADYLQAADVFVSASLTEGCPMAVIEALACGLPVVLSDIGPHREIVRLAPQSGRLFPTKDVSALAEVLEEIMSENYSSLSKAALGIVCAHFNARRMSAQYQALYVECCKECNDSYCK